MQDAAARSGGCRCETISSAVPAARAAAASCRAARSASSARTCAPCAGTRSRSSASASRTRGPPARRPRAAPLHHQVRQRQVVAEPRVDLDVVRRGARVDRAVAARDRAEPRLGLAQHHLVAPVDPFLVRAVGRRRAAAGRRRMRPRDRRTARTSCAQRVGRPRRVRVGERDDLALGLRAPPGPAPRPCRRAGSRSPARPRYCSAISSVRSVEASEVTTICSFSRG